jgi:hypothetical protein
MEVGVVGMEVGDLAVAGTWEVEDSAVAAILGVEDSAAAGVAEVGVAGIPEECILEVESTSAEEWVIIGVEESGSIAAVDLVIFVAEEVSILGMVMVLDMASEDTGWAWG